MEAIRTKPEIGIADAELSASLLSQLEPRLFTRAEYHAMAKAGILGDDERVELIEGVIVQMAPIGDWHSGTVRRLNKHAGKHLGDAADVDVQNAIVLARSEPEPDLVIVKPNLPGKPEAKDISLVIEVSETTLRIDRNVKAVIYAAAGIPEYWIVDHPNDQIIQYTVPKEGKYEQQRLWKRGDTISSTVPPTLTLPVDLILGDAPDAGNATTES
jgi:Uma2 family endonuclease